MNNQLARVLAQVKLVLIWPNYLARRNHVRKRDIIISASSISHIIIPIWLWIFVTFLFWFHFLLFDIIQLLGSSHIAPVQHYAVCIYNFTFSTLSINKYWPVTFPVIVLHRQSMFFLYWELDTKQPIYFPPYYSVVSRSTFCFEPAILGTMSSPTLPALFVACPWATGAGLPTVALWLTCGVV